MTHYKMKSYIPNEIIDELGPEANESMVWTYEDVKDDAKNFEMSPRAFIDRYLEKISGSVQISDGWHGVSTNTEVYVEDGMILRAVKTVSNDRLSASVYKYDKKYASWINVCPISYTTFCNGYKAKRYAVK